MPKSSLVPVHTPADQSSPQRLFRVDSDGLPLLPCFDASSRVACASSAAPRAVSQFGRVDSHEDVRAQLLKRYEGQRVTEMTLRIDTQLELLRRSCFAQRNAQWEDATPEQFEFRPITSDAWTPQPANAKLLLRQLQAEDGNKEFFPSISDKNQAENQFVRERPWPPAEFALKPVTRPSRGRGGKRKAAPMAAVLEPMPLLSKTCSKCRTQSTPLWRSMKKEKPVATNSLADAFIAQGMGGITQEEVDLCLHCFLKHERADLFDKKRSVKRRQERQKDQSSVALLEKKRLKQQINLLRKQQTGELVESEVQETPVILKFTREEIEAATAAKERKKDRKHSRKDKKKKKKHRRKREMIEDSESDGPTPIPSPAQMKGYVYADRESSATPQVSAFQTDERNLSHLETTVVYTEPEALQNSFDNHDDSTLTPSRASSRKRKSLQRSEPVLLAESPASVSKKRKTSSSRSKRGAASAASASVEVVVPPTPSSRKRPRTKKELARERELRAQGQYCPVCSEVYEDDDQNTFVCCDSCELWVHGACDPTLTQELIAAMANTEDKYICPLCAGR